MKILYSLLDSFRIIFLLFSKHASGYIKPAPLYFFICRNMPLVGQGLLIHDVSKSHSTKHHRLYYSSSRVISSSQRPLPDNTQHSEQTFILGPRRFRVPPLKYLTYRQQWPSTCRQPVFATHINQTEHRLHFAS